MHQGIPESAEAPPVSGTPPSGQTTSPPAQLPPSTQPAAVPSSGPNANPLDLFPQVQAAYIINWAEGDFQISILDIFLLQGLPNLGSNPAGANTLEFLRNSQQVSPVSHLPFPLSYCHKIY